MLRCLVVSRANYLCTLKPDAHLLDDNSQVVASVETLLSADCSVPGLGWDSAAAVAGGADALENLAACSIICES